MPIARALFYFATSLSLVGVGYSLATEPPPLAVAVAALVAYVALVTGGVLFSGFGMFADVLTHGGSGARGVALTFDDGPDPSTTPRVLDALDAANAKATVFLIGRKVDAHPELAASIRARGHLVAVHGYEHERLFSLRSPGHVRRDLERAILAIERAIGVRPRLFRAPIGHVSPAMARVADALDLTIVGWSVRARDGLAGTTVDAVVRRIAPSLEDGAIVLLHDAAERGGFTPAGVLALPELLAAAALKQLPCVRLDDWA